MATEKPFAYLGSHGGLDFDVSRSKWFQAHKKNTYLVRSMARQASAVGRVSFIKAQMRARRRLKWPGEAAVVVSVVHLAKGAASAPVLDGRPVRRISAYLVEGEIDTSPSPLVPNAAKAFVGSYVLGMGFTFDDVAAAKGEAESLETMQVLIKKDPRNAERIFPYLGGEEVNNDPAQRHHRCVIDFGAMSEAQARNGWPDLLEIVERRVKPKRLEQASIVNPERWWMHARPAGKLYHHIRSSRHVLATTRVSPYLTLSTLNPIQVFSEQLVLFAYCTFAPFAVLQSRIHEIWARFFSSSMKDDLRYAPSDCFRTFPFPKGFENDPALEATGEAHNTFRAKLMIDRSEGLTKTYNRFHTRGENAPDVARLRTLHATMDAAVLRAYDWGDLADRAAPEFIEQDADEGKKPKTRLDWPAEFKDEVLAKLLILNAERAATERAAGVAIPEDEDDEID